MNKFDTRTVELMRSVLEEVCSHIPAGATEARTFVAAKILECARGGNQGRDHKFEFDRRSPIGPSNVACSRQYRPLASRSFRASPYREQQIKILDIAIQHLDSSLFRVLTQFRP
jgi:hypothetical protein